MDVGLVKVYETCCVLSRMRRRRTPGLKASHLEASQGSASCSILFLTHITKSGNQPFGSSGLTLLPSSLRRITASAISIIAWPALTKVESLLPPGSKKNSPASRQSPPREGGTGDSHWLNRGCRLPTPILIRLVWLPPQFVLS